jgi:hypothetical protein
MVAKARPRLFRALFADVARQEHLSTFLTLAHSGFSAGLLARADLPDDLLLACSRHSEASIRCAVLVLLADPPSTVLRYTSVDFEILCTYWRYDIGPSDPDFRQAANGAWVKLFGRLRSSTYAAERAATGAAKAGYEDAEAKAYVTSSRALLDAATRAIRSALRPCSPYRMQRNALLSLVILLGSGVDPSYTGELDRSTRRSKEQATTQPTAGALWPFTLSMCSDSILVRSLVRCLMSTYDDVRDAAFAILLDCPRPLPGFESVETVERELLEPAMALLRNRRESESTSGALLVELCLRTVDSPKFTGGALALLSFVMCEVVEQTPQPLSWSASWTQLKRTSPSPRSNSPAPRRPTRSMAFSLAPARSSPPSLPQRRLCRQRRTSGSCRS